MLRELSLCIIAALAALACAAAQPQTNNPTAMQQTDNADVLVDVKTTLGDIRLRLFGDTPKHRDNFVKLVNEGFYNGVLFHRVINEFMIQTGDPESVNAPKGKMLGSGGPGYNIEAEIVYPKHFHRRGALAAARQGDQVNPTRKSSGSQFYIVTGQAADSTQLKQMEQQLLMARKQGVFQQLAAEQMDTIRSMQRSGDHAGLQKLQQQLIAITEERVAADPTPVLTDAQREAYTTVGGTPHLDGQYTVFGEVVSGMDVVDKIEKVATDPHDRPLDDIKILSMQIVK